MGSVLECELDSYKLHSKQVQAMLGSKDRILVGKVVLGDMVVDMVLQLVLGKQAHTLVRIALQLVVHFLVLGLASGHYLDQTQ